MESRTLTWCVQDNLRQVNDGVETLLRTLEFKGIPYELLSVIPFDDSPLEVKAKDPVVFFGSTALRDRAWLLRRKPGVFFDPERFSFPALLEGFGESLLNHDSTLTTVGAFFVDSAGPSDPGEVLFLRPADDSKAFVGAVKTRSEWVRELESGLGVRGGCSLATPIQVGTPKAIEREWRLFVAGDQIVAQCQNRVWGTLRLSLEVPEEVVAFGQSMVGRYKPARVFTLDVCRLEDKSLKVIETNCFNCSGLYLANPVDLVEAVTSLVENDWLVGQ